MLRLSSLPPAEPPVGRSARSSSKPDRLANLEAAVTAIQHTLEVQFTRIAAIQAELDLLNTKPTRTAGGEAECRTNDVDDRILVNR